MQNTLSGVQGKCRLWCKLKSLLLFLQIKLQTEQAKMRLFQEGQLNQGLVFAIKSASFRYLIYTEEEIKCVFDDI